MRVYIYYIQQGAFMRFTGNRASTLVLFLLYRQTAMTTFVIAAVFLKVSTKMDVTIIPNASVTRRTFIYTANVFKKIRSIIMQYISSSFPRIYHCRISVKTQTRDL